MTRRDELVARVGGQRCSHTSKNISLDRSPRREEPGMSTASCAESTWYWEEENVFEPVENGVGATERNDDEFVRRIDGYNTRYFRLSTPVTISYRGLSANDIYNNLQKLSCACRLCSLNLRTSIRSASQKSGTSDVAAKARQLV